MRTDKEIMRIKIYFALGILTFYKEINFVYGKSVQVTSDNEGLQRQFENYMNCAKMMNSSECLEITGRKRKGSDNAGNNVVIIGGGGSHEHGEYEDGYYIELDDDHGNKKGKRKRRGKKKKGKKGKKGSKIYKKMKPVMYGIGGLKLLLDHFVLKKLAFVSFFTFILSKISFILATLVALKQFFHTPVPHQRAESHKVEVIHIPIKKYRPKHSDEAFDESKLIPVTYDSLDPDTTPSYFTFPNQNEFISSEENFIGNYLTRNRDRDNDNENSMFSASNDDNADLLTDEFDRSDKQHDEKNFYINHVHSPFV